VRHAAALFLLVAQGCATTGRPAVVTPPESQCAANESFDGTGCRQLNTRTESLEQGTARLEEFQAEEAARLLEAAKQEGPYGHSEHIRVYEQLSVAYSYLGMEAKAVDAFDMLLSLSPGHAISYTLSPKATFLFERARKEAANRARPEVRVTWPRDLRVDRAVPLEVEVMSDPKSFLTRARLHSRRKGAKRFRTMDLKLSRRGGYSRIQLPPTAPDATADDSMEVYLSAFDQRGNEVLRWGHEHAPREIPLAYVAPRPWYRKWWVWTAIGSAVAIGTGVTVYAATRSPSDTVGVDVIVR